MSEKKIKTFFVCSGLGVVNRGYESFTRESFDVLRDDPRIDAYLYKGGGLSSKREKKLFNMPRFSALTKLIGKILNKESYTIEQFTFFISLIAPILLKKPNVILVSDFILSTYLWHLRAFLNLKYKILFSNGAPNGPPFHRCDHVQQLLPIHFDIAVKGGTSAEKQTILPYGINISDADFLNPDEIKKIKKELHIPESKKVILSVAAINNHHKRINFLIDEFARLNHENYYLIMLGQIDNESQAIIQYATEKLPFRNYIIRSVKHNEVKKYYQIADFFVLSSLTEGLPRVMIEALSFGLPTLVHDYPLAHQILSEFGYYNDFQKTGSISNLISHLSKTDFNSLSLREARKEFATKNYSWNALKERYVEMLMKTATRNDK